MKGQPASIEKGLNPFANGPQSLLIVPEQHEIIDIPQVQAGLEFAQYEVIQPVQVHVEVVQRRWR